MTPETKSALLNLWAVIAVAMMFLPAAPGKIGDWVHDHLCGWAYAIVFALWVVCYPAYILITTIIGD